MTERRAALLLAVLSAVALPLLCAAQLRTDAQVFEDLPAAARELPAARSGYHYQSEEIQALQDDDFANPAMLWVDRGRVLWRQVAGSEPSCEQCHGEAQSLRGAAVRYPQYDAGVGRLLNLEGRINQCRTERQGLEALAYESDALLSLTALVSHQSRGLPIDVSIDGAAQAYFEEGRRYFYTRRGQMNLACYHCHQLNAGRYLRGDRLSQGQATGYPIYRLDWQTLGSLHRRLRFCNTGVRAEPFAFGDPAYVSLELFLAWRARGLPWEAPAVRR
ncbi:MAG: sulfur oxidation c-type cytochrome SoxA [Halieaceae bacterium]|jgi:sulfur-oxidizing protein SoxA|nr:sulfur oxidation c-type cytochrome SoxA [Halieaceae bacterium]